MRVVLAHSYLPGNHWYRCNSITRKTIPQIKAATETHSMATYTSGSAAAALDFFPPFALVELRRDMISLFYQITAGQHRTDRLVRLNQQDFGFA